MSLQACSYLQSFPNLALCSADFFLNFILIINYSYAQKWIIVIVALTLLKVSLQVFFGGRVYNYRSELLSFTVFTVGLLFLDLESSAKCPLQTISLGGQAF